jgi:hypothetical protein
MLKPKRSPVLAILRELKWAASGEVILSLPAIAGVSSMASSDLRSDL